MEHAPRRRRASFGSLVPVFTFWSFACAAVVAYLLESPCRREQWWTGVGGFHSRSPRRWVSQASICASIRMKRPRYRRSKAHEIAHAPLAGNPAGAIVEHSEAWRVRIGDSAVLLYIHNVFRDLSSNRQTLVSRHVAPGDRARPLLRSSLVLASSPAWQATARRSRAPAPSSSRQFIRRSRWWIG